MAYFLPLASRNPPIQIPEDFSRFHLASVQNQLMVRLFEMPRIPQLEEHPNRSFYLVQLKAYKTRWAYTLGTLFSGQDKLSSIRQNR